MNWISLLGLDALVVRWRAAFAETSIAAEDRLDLARLEWQGHKRSLQSLLVFGMVLAGLTIVMLVVLSMALMVHFWDTEYRTMVAWWLGGGWFALWALVLWRLLAALRMLARPFALTRMELQTDWKVLKEKL